MKKIQRYKIVILFVLLTVMGVIFYYVNPDGILWELYNILGVATTIALSVIAFWGYMEYIKFEDLINIYFNVNGEKKDTRLTVLRKNCTRSEIQGLLGMIYNGKDRYEIKSLKSDRNILNVFNDVQTGKTDEVIIEVTVKEFEQFDI